MSFTFHASANLKGMEASERKPSIRFCTNNTLCRDAYRNGDMIVGHRVYGHPKSTVQAFYCSLCSRDIRTGRKMSRPNRGGFTVTTAMQAIEASNVHRMDTPKPKHETPDHTAGLCKECGKPFTRNGYTVERATCDCGFTRTRLADTRASESKPKSHGKIALKG